MIKVEVIDEEIMIDDLRGTHSVIISREDREYCVFVGSKKKCNVVATLLREGLDHILN